MANTGMNGTVSVAVDLFGRFVYVTNSYSSNASAYRIAENGALTSVVGAPFPAGYLCHAVAVSPES